MHPLAADGPGLPAAPRHRGADLQVGEQVSGAVLVAALHLPEALGEDPVRWSDVAAAAIGSARAALAAASLREERADAFLIVASTPDRAAALDAAFAIVAGVRRAAAEGLHGHVHGRPPAAIAVGWGSHARGPGGLVGPEIARAWRLASLGTYEVLCTDGFVRAGALPAGYGVFRAPAAQEALSGFPAHVVADFR